MKLNWNFLGGGGRRKTNKMPATLALRVMLGLIHLVQLYASPIDKSTLANGIV